MSDERIVQTAPFPRELADIVEAITYRPNWRICLTTDLDRGQGSHGMTLEVLTRGYDTYHVDQGPTYAASYNRESWLRWVLDRLIEVETHEACEFFQVDGRRPFAPNHGPGWDPYAVRELNTAEAAETTFRGQRREGSQADGWRWR